MVVMPSQSAELMGFVPYNPNQRTGLRGITLIICKSYMRLSGEAMLALGMPEKIIIFLDYNGKRLMIQPAEKDEKNALTVSMMAKSKQRCCLYIRGLKDEIRLITGKHGFETGELPGHLVAKAKTPSVIFHFDDLKENGAEE